MERHIKTYILPLLEKYYGIELDKKDNWNLIQINRKLKMWDEGKTENELLTMRVIINKFILHKVIDI